MSKILYITNYNDSEKVGYCISDYLNDLTFYGLKELYGDNIIDSTQIIHLYKENHDKIDHKRLFGILSGTWLLNKDTTDRSNIEEKINPILNLLRWNFFPVNAIYQKIEGIIRKKIIPIKFNK